MAGISGRKWAIRNQKEGETISEYITRLDKQDKLIRILRIPLFPFALIVKLYKWTYDY